MKHFLFTIQVVSSKRAAFQTKRTTLYKIVRNAPVYLGYRESQFEDDQQAVMNIAEDHKVLPREYFKPGPMGGMFYTPARLRELGIAKFHQL